MVEPLAIFCRTLGFLGTPVEKHCSINRTDAPGKRRRIGLPETPNNSEYDRFEGETKEITLHV